MAWYEYVCPCGTIRETQLFAKIGEPEPEGWYCGKCEQPYIRQVSLPQTRPTAEPYFNHNVGTYIKDDAHLHQVLKEKARKNSELTGTDHNYVPVYPGDLTNPETMKRLGVGAGADGGESIEHSRRTNPGAYKPSTTKVIT